MSNVLHFPTTRLGRYEAHAYGAVALENRCAARSTSEIWDDLRTLPMLDESQRAALIAELQGVS